MSGLGTFFFCFGRFVAAAGALVVPRGGVGDEDVVRGEYERELGESEERDSRKASGEGPSEGEKGEASDVDVE